MPPTDLLDQLAAADTSALRTILEHTLQRLIEAEATAYIGAEPGEHSATRTIYRNGHRPKTLDTRMGRLDLRIPEVRTGGFFPSLPEHRRRIERALLAVIQEAYVHGVSTRTVDDVGRPWAAATSPRARSAASAAHLVPPARGLDPNRGAGHRQPGAPRAGRRAPAPQSSALAAQYPVHLPAPGTGPLRRL
jgi:hypothetical protein